MSERVRIGVLGCADIAWRRTLPAMCAVDDIELAVVASRDAEKAKRFATRFGCAAAVGYEAVLDRDDIDAVYIPLPVMLHAEWIERSLAAGKHVLAEKPLTSDHATTVRLLEQARSAGLVLMENFMFLRHTQHARVAQLMTEIGQVRALTSAFTIPPKPDDDIRYRADLGGGALLDIGVYPLRAAMRLLGNDLEVAGATLRVEKARGVVLGGSALLYTPEGVSAHVVFGMEHAYRSSYEIAAGEGVLSSDRVFTPPAGYQPIVTINRQDRREELTLPADDQVTNAVRGFADAVMGVPVDLFHAEAAQLAWLVGQVEQRARTTLVA